MFLLSKNVEFTRCAFGVHGEAMTYLYVFYKLTTKYFERKGIICIEWLSQMQAKESTDIPENVYSLIISEIKKNRIINNSNLTPGKMKSILKKLNLQHYYEHIPFILSKITGKPPPTISRATEEKIKNMFDEMQKPFQKHCPKNRTNFLSYSYVLRKLFQLLELDDLASYCSLLKNRTKLREQDKLWEKICIDLKWQFHPSI